jgi:competence protein ComEA
VYVLGPGDRVADAIDAAGGSAAGADIESVNLAAPLIDGSRVYLPEFGEEVPFPPTPVFAPVGGSDTAVGPIEVNTADVQSLQRLPGIGPATAQAIVVERERNGPFVSFGDLERVPGIGPAKLAALDGLIVT